MASLFLGRGGPGGKAAARREAPRLLPLRGGVQRADAGIDFTVDGRMHRIRNAGELEQFLCSRQVPRPGAASDGSLAAGQRDEQSAGLRRQLALLEQLATDVNTSHGATIAQLRRLNRRVFTKEHAWRALWGQLLALEAVPAWSLECMLRHYIGYLRNRIAERAGLRGESENAEALRQTAVLDRGLTAGLAGVAAGAMALPSGQAIGFGLPLGAALDLHLATRPFRLCHDSTGYRLLDGGSDAPGLLRRPVYRLREGRNLIGRAPDCDLRVLPRYRDVSRVHLLIDLTGDRLWLTDLSAHGTHLSDSAWSCQLPGSNHPGPKARKTGTGNGTSGQNSRDNLSPTTVF